MNILVIHGSNLNLLGTREPEAYGTTTLDQVNEAIVREAKELGYETAIHQSNHEGVIVDLLHEAIGSVVGAVINPGGYCHTSRAIEDAISAVDYPVVEVHMTNIHAREPGPISYTAIPSVGVIAGFRKDSYVLGIRALHLFLQTARTG